MQNNPVRQENHDTHLPVQFRISFDKVLQLNNSSGHPDDYPHYILKIKELFKNIPELADGFSDFSLLEKYKKEIDDLLNPLFPEALSSTEIKAAGLPYLFLFFKYSTPFKAILDQQDTGNHLAMNDVHPDELYIGACMMILNLYYGYNLDYKKAFHLTVPDPDTGISRYYRLKMNHSFVTIIPTSSAPQITADDQVHLLNNLNNINYWKQKFPPGSYIFKGFSWITLSDFTDEQAMLELHEALLKNKDDKIEKIRQSLGKYLSIDGLKVGYSVFNMAYKGKTGSSLETKESLFLNEPEIHYRRYFSEEIVSAVFHEKQMLSISDVTQYGLQNPDSMFYKTLIRENIQSIILIPVELKSGTQLALFELASEHTYDLNLFIQHRLERIRTVLEASLERIVKRFEAQIELAIQKECTSIHPSVRWKFRQAAVKYLKDRELHKKHAGFEKIVFKNVYPLYGQTDVKGSTEARNGAITKDLTTQLKLIKDILKHIEEKDLQPRHMEYLDQVKDFMEDLEKEFRVDTESRIIKFLTTKINPEFRKMLENDQYLSDDIENYYEKIDPDLGTIYHYRKHFDTTITLLNKKMTALLDFRQAEAQQIYPHFFERFKTDGVEHNMYVGASIAGNKPFHKKYLRNLRLWQLQVICQMENEFYNNKQNYPLSLKVASLVFVFNKPINISFINDEKRFDIDGTYNARYEVIKKRIDKAYVKGTQTRVTEPGYITIIYSSDEDEHEYLPYIEYLRSKGILNDKTEKLELEDLQDITGLKAIKAGIVIQDKKKNDSSPPEYYYMD